MAIVRIPCTGRKRDFMELSVRPIRACLLQGTVSMGNRPRGGGGSPGRGMEQPAAPVSCVSPKTSFHASSRPTPASLSHLPSMPSRKKPHHAAVTRGIPHEDGGCTFIQIPVTPPGICPRTVHGLDTERFIKPVRHWFDGLTRIPLPGEKTSSSCIRRQCEKPLQAPGSTNH